MVYLKINPLKLGISGGIIGGLVAFLTTILGVLELSNTANFMAQTFWGVYGYSVTLPGAFIGLIIGFVYAFILLWLGALIYNKLISS